MPLSKEEILRCQKILKEWGAYKTSKSLGMEYTVSQDGSDSRFNIDRFLKNQPDVYERTRVLVAAQMGQKKDFLICDWRIHYQEDTYTENKPGWKFLNILLECGHRVACLVEGEHHSDQYAIQYICKPSDIEAIKDRIYIARKSDLYVKLITQLAAVVDVSDICILDDFETTQLFKKISTDSVEKISDRLDLNKLRIADTKRVLEVVETSHIGVLYISPSQINTHNLDGVFKKLNWRSLSLIMICGDTDESSFGKNRVQIQTLDLDKLFPLFSKGNPAIYTFGISFLAESTHIVGSIPEGIQSILIASFEVAPSIIMKEVKLPSSLRTFNFIGDPKSDELPYFNRLPNLNQISFKSLSSREEAREKLQNVFGHVDQKIDFNLGEDSHEQKEIICSREGLETFLFKDSVRTSQLYNELFPSHRLPHSSKRTTTKFELDTRVQSNPESTLDITPYAYEENAYEETAWNKLFCFRIFIGAINQLVSIERLKFREIIYDTVDVTGQTFRLQQSEQACCQHQSLPLPAHPAIRWKASITENFFLDTANDESYFVKKTIEISSQWQPLPTITAHDKILYMEQLPLDVDLQFNPTLMQYVIRLKKADIRSESVTLSYIAQQTQNPEPSTNPPSTQPLPVTLRDAIKVVLAMENSKFPLAFSKFQSALQRSSSLVDKEKHIIDYCRNFINDQALLNLSASAHYFKDATPRILETNPVYRDFFRVLIEGKGACRHRSLIAMTLCQYYGIPAYVVRLPGLHQYLEMDHDGIRKKVDLGGAPAQERSDPIDLHPFSQGEDSDEEKYPAKLESTPEGVAKAITKPELINCWAPYFEQDHSWYSHCQSAEALIGALCQHKARIFVKTQSLEQARAIAFYVGQQARQQGTPHFYAESSATINRHKSHVQVDASGGLPITIDGPLLTILSDENALIQLPLFSFTDTEVANYKSLLDNQSKLDQYESQVQQVIFYGDKIPEDSSTRFDAEMLWPEHIPLPTFQYLIHADDDGEEDEKIALGTPDCYHNSDRFAAHWVGEVGVDGDHFCFNPGWLPQAISQDQKQLTLADAPLDNPRFHEALATTKVQGCIWANGEMQALPEVFQFRSITVAHTPHDNIDETTHTLRTHDFSNRRVWMMNQQNSPLFFEQNSVDAEGKLHMHQPGWHKSIKPADTLCISQTLSEGQLRQLNDFLQDKSLHVIYPQQFQDEEHEVPRVELEQALPAKSGATLVEEADTEFMVSYYAKTLGLDDDAIFDMAENAGWAQFIEQSELASKKLPLRIKRSFSPLLSKLQAGETVILHCHLSEKSYHQIETLFAPTPYIQVNGERLEITGKLIVVTPPRLYTCPFSNRHFSIDTASLWRAYEKRLQAEHTAIYSEGNFEKIKVFYQYLQRATFNVPGAPPQARMSFDRVRNMLWALSYEEEYTHHDNPTKSFSLRDFDKGSENYVYLNVIAKLLFAHNARPEFLRSEKLARYLASDPNYHWHRANCLSAALLRKIWGINEPGNIEKLFSEGTRGQPQLKAEYVERLDRFLHSEENKPAPPHHYPTRKAKVNARIRSFREVSPLLLFKGPPGVGKSHRAKEMMKKFKPTAQFIGTEHIQLFLAHSEEKDSTAAGLFLDEANTGRPGSLTPLAAFKRKLKPSTAIFMTANPESFGGRFYDPIVQDAPTIRVPEKTDAELRAIILPLVQQFKGYNEEIETICSEEMIQAFRLAAQCFGAEMVSLRDLSQTIYRYLFRIEHHPELPIKALAYSACLDEWSAMTGNPKLMESFSQRLQKIFQMDAQPALALRPPQKVYDHVTQTIALPSARRERMAYCLYEHLALIQWRKAEFGDIRLGKKIVLMEGASGVAKSLTAGTIAAAMGIKYVQLTVGDYAATKATLEKLFPPEKEPSAGRALTVIILDELNLQPALEQLLIPLVDDRDDIIVITTQNPNTPAFAGRSTLSKALLNRSHRLAAPGYSDAEFEAITRGKLLKKVGVEAKEENADLKSELIADDAKQIVQAFRKEQQIGARQGRSLNGRTFFKRFKAIEEGCFLVGVDEQKSIIADFKGRLEALPEYDKSQSVDDYLRTLHTAHQECLSDISRQCERFEQYCQKTFSVNQGSDVLRKKLDSLLGERLQGIRKQLIDDVKGAARNYQVNRNQKYRIKDGIRGLFSCCYPTDQFVREEFINDELIPRLETYRIQLDDVGQRAELDPSLYDKSQFTPRTKNKHDSAYQHSIWALFDKVTDSVHLVNGISELLAGDQNHENLEQRQGGLARI